MIVAHAWVGGLVGLLAQAPPAQGANPAYSASGIVNSAGFSPQPLAPNSLVTIFGTDLSFSRQAARLDAQGSLPTELANVQVLVANSPAQLLYVSEVQINFLVPNWLRPGDVPLRVVRQGVAGPEVMIMLRDVAPSLFRLPGDWVIAAHADGALITPDVPARAGEVVVLYAAGLGLTDPSLPLVGPPRSAAPIRRLSDFRLTLDGVALSGSRVYYAGATPGSFGLYQVNLALPDDAPADPEIRISVGDQGSPVGLRLPLR